MKLTILFTVVAILQVSASTFAQKITLSEKNTSLKTIFEKIREQTGYDFIVSTANLKQSKPVTISVRNEELNSTLDQIFLTQPLLYVLQEKMVIVSKKNTLPTKLSDQTSGIPLNITGKVTDTSGVSLPGASLKVKGSTSVYITDSEGRFNIIANAGDEIEVSFVGFQLYTFNIEKDQSFYTVVLHSASSKLNEVTVLSTGYQLIPKERATGSFVQPDKTMYDARVSTDIISKLNGITSGLIFNANTTATLNGQGDINIRGRSTIFANDQPLIVVDNFPYSGNIANINPNDVESITVLKDAAAASIWGVRAGNGVIVITTKAGKLNQRLRISFNANISVSQKPDLNYNPNKLNSSSYIELEQFLFKQGYYDDNLGNTVTGPVISPVVQFLAANRSGALSNQELQDKLNSLKNLNVNEQLNRYFNRPAVNQQYALTLTGGSTKASYFLSTGYDRNLSGIRGNSNERVTINSQNTFVPLKDLEITAGINIVQTGINSDNTYNNLRNRIFPYTQFADSHGNPLAIPYQYNQNFINKANASGFQDWSYVPLNELGAADNFTKVKDIRLLTGLKYSFIKGLNLDFKYQYQNSNNQNRIFQGKETYFTRNLINQFSILTNGVVSGYNVPKGDILSLSNGNTISQNIRGSLNYNLAWKDNSITALAGYELSETTIDGNSFSLYGYNDDLATFSNIDPLNYFNTNPTGSAAIPSGLQINSRIARLRSAFANAAYTYKDRYTLSGSARIDGSNYFGVATNQKNVPLWSAGFKWDADKEVFYKSSILPRVSLRASYGYNGNLISSITGVTTFLYQSNAPFTNLNYAQVSNIGNPDLRWETTAIGNIGLDFGFINEIISGSLEYYFKKGKDLLGYKSFPENSGIASLQGNYSSMKGNGYDLTLTSRNLSGNLNWFTTLLFSHSTDKVTHYDVIPLSNELIGNSGASVPNVGKPVYAFYAYKSGGLDSQTGNPIGYLNGMKSQDYAAIITNTAINDLEYIGPARPTYFGGLNNRFTYNGFVLAFQVNYKLGYYFMAPTINYSQITTNGKAFLNVNKDYDSRWKYPGDENSTSVPSINYPFSPARDQFYQHSTVNIHKGDHIRLQDITLSYDFVKSKTHNLPFTSLQLFTYANNVAILWKANHAGLDPDAVPGPGDNLVIPVTRTFSIGLKGTF